jgi:glycosyltransferase involved in cell wall biosynthesis
MKLGIVQNHLGVDGRSRTVAAIIELLNERGIVPDLLSFSGVEDHARFRTFANDSLLYEPVRIPRPHFLAGDLLQETLLPLLVRHRVRGYDLLITSNTGLQGYPEGPQLLHLVTFPLELVPENEDRYRRPVPRLYGSVSRLLMQIASLSGKRRGIWTANSEFTRDAMVRAYGLTAGDITVLYPPVDVAEPLNTGERQCAVLSLAGFHADKRQLEQIDLASQLPDVAFYIVGTVRSAAYYRRCREVADNLPNVHLVADAPWPAVQSLLAACKVFLHSKHNEHFGISTAEAIAAGCLPVVHDSGGQRELVPFAALRYRTVAEAKESLSRALDGNCDELAPALRARLHTFSKDAFRRRFLSVLDGASLAGSKTRAA